MGTLSTVPIQIGVPGSEMLPSVSPYLRNDSSHCDNGFALPPGKFLEALTNSLSSLQHKPFKERSGLLMITSGWKE